MKYTKPALTFAGQAALLASRGLLISNMQHAENFLAHVNYYRLAGYILPFESDHATHQIILGTRFEDISNLYLFDRALRLLVMDAIEKIEVSVRTQWAYHFAHNVNPHAYLDPIYAQSHKRLARQLTFLASHIDESTESFVAHHRSKYNESDFPPIWVACELLSLGQLSNWYALMKPAMRKKMARTYRLDQQVLESLLRHLSHVRNLCAHHARLWNRIFVTKSSLPKKGVPNLLSAMGDHSDRFYKTACLIAHLLRCIDRNDNWGVRLHALVDQYQPKLIAMGFPIDWRERKLWVS